MALRVSGYNERGPFSNALRSNLMNGNSRENPQKLSSTIRQKSESRGSTKMPPITNNSTASMSRSLLNSSQNKFYSGASPMRSGGYKLQSASKRVEEREKTPSGLKQLSVETHNDPKLYSGNGGNNQYQESGTGQSQSVSNSNHQPTKSWSNNLTGTHKANTVGLNTLNAAYSNKAADNVGYRGFSPQRFGYNSNKIQPTPLQSDSKFNAYNPYNPSPQKNGQPSGSGSRGSIIANTPGLPYFEPTKCSTKKNGVVKAYAANTNQGIVRNYNEDRVSIILNIMKPPNLDTKEDWPICSFFGVYDGHGGTNCADFLRDNLHQFVIRDKSFPSNPVEAIKNGFVEAERKFTEFAQQMPYDIDKSGSCAIVCLIVGEMLYCANVGDSRAFMSVERGKKVVALSRDHKPNDEDEQKRILSNGGKIYQSQIPQAAMGFHGGGFQRMILGPHRVLPGRLSVSRTFGDIEAKIVKYGGNPNVVVAEPEIKTFKLNEDCDYFVLACDGIFDKLNNAEANQCVWDSTQLKAPDIHHACSYGVEMIMKESLLRRTLDNVTVVLVGLKGFKRALFPKQKKPTINNDQDRNSISYAEFQQQKRENGGHSRNSHGGHSDLPEKKTPLTPSKFGDGSMGGQNAESAKNKMAHKRPFQPPEQKKDPMKDSSEFQRQYLASMQYRSPNHNHSYSSGKNLKKINKSHV